MMAKSVLELMPASEHQRTEAVHAVGGVTQDKERPLARDDVRRLQNRTQIGVRICGLHYARAFLRGAQPSSELCESAYLEPVLEESKAKYQTEDRFSTCGTAQGTTKSLANMHSEAEPCGEMG
jgi:hypothetical protein